MNQLNTVQKRAMASLIMHLQALYFTVRDIKSADDVRLGPNSTIGTDGFAVSVSFAPFVRVYIEDPELSVMTASIGSTKIRFAPCDIHPGENGIPGRIAELLEAYR